MNCWGWATWKRAWRHYDLEMSLWPEIRDGGWLFDILRDDLAVTYWTRKFDAAYRGEIDTWDYQWTFACWIQRGLSALPAVNLVRNIGFGEGATHTRGDRKLDVPPQNLDFPIAHPPYVLADDRADAWSQRHIFGFGAIEIRDRLRFFVRSRLGKYL